MTLRDDHLQRLSETTFDVLVVGGGINGAVAAASLSARGLSVALVDRGDFASETSQQSSNLAWGGIKYMEGWEFPLVRKLCVSRNQLLRCFPSTVREIRFFTVHTPGFRHGRWKLFLGTLFYWLLGSFFTRPPRLLSRADVQRDEPLIEGKSIDGAIEYSDAYLYDNDARFVFNFVRSAMRHGCVAVNYVESEGGERKEDGLWHLRVRDRMAARSFEVRARVVVNACGPYVDEHNRRTGQHTEHRHVFSKGVHLIVPQVTGHHRVIAFFADDGRLFFVIPMGTRTCIGTTDTKVESPEAVVTEEDRRFILDNINKRMRLERPLASSDVIAERCGVRPLVVKGKGAGKGDWLQMSRKHVIVVDRASCHLSIFGGKLTDCINVGEEIARHVAGLGFAMPKTIPRWYGEPDETEKQRFLSRCAQVGIDSMTPAAAPEPMSTRLWRRYGSDALAIVEAIAARRELGDVVIEGTEVLRAELEFVARHELVVKLEDFLRRRSMLSLVTRHEVLRASKGLMEACHLLFGAEGPAKFEEYFGTVPVSPRRYDVPTSV